MTDASLIAAVDLGSNSFRLQIARVQDGSLVPLTTLKETVRLAGGIDADGCLTAAIQNEALAALRRFGKTLSGLARSQVRIVATNTFRVARNIDDFQPLAEAALGYPIEIVAGQEEARLIYIGAAHSLPASRKARLIVDIGGGSTELIIGRQFDAQTMESVLLGCVSWSQRFFPDGQITEAALRAAELAACELLEPVAGLFGPTHWHATVGTSGTSRSIADVLELNGLSESGITREGMRQLRQILLDAGHVDAVELKGLRADRRPVLAGGFAIMAAVFEMLGIEKMTITQGALRDGVLYDLMARNGMLDVRERTVGAFQRRYQVDVAQANRVAELAGLLFRQLHADDEDTARALRHAARLHEVGRLIAHVGYHKHGAYVLQHADMHGFSRREQARLAQWALVQRGSLAKLGTERLDGADWAAILALRLAVLFCRGRKSQWPAAIRLRGSGSDFLLQIDPVWLSANPLTAFALDEETRQWQKPRLIIARPTS
ncbi:Ppx/GppA phosphatase family protein [Jeongeupia chitinilytica]|uniref:Exopolyphosphatase n=1 Tax=Jeongeupia chitinilytica TaxID=1041641 RepID=A0ABQ3H628_9NEIS|nr:Ppx/GppA phosphatase family protein [Jeongeupia chitinilytica]GHD68820.1 exopolyphosphatase [Jeongeupia chitinilytica]